MSDAKIQRGDENSRSKNVFLDTKFSFYGGEFCVTQSYLTLFFLYVYRGRQRRRSKSASRVRHYSPAGRNRSRYLVREYFSDESSSAESEDDIIYRRRSQSNLVSLIKNKMYNNDNRMDGQGFDIVKAKNCQHLFCFEKIVSHFL